MIEQRTTLSDYEAIGGGPAVRAVVEDFYLRVVYDTQLAPFFVGVDLARLKRHQALLVAKVLGGPDGYPGLPLRTAHMGMGITADDFSRVVGHLGAALRHAGVGEDIIGRAAAAVLATEPDIVERP
jgi:hemoglobin